MRQQQLLTANNKMYKMAQKHGFNGSYADFCEMVNQKNSALVAEGNNSIHSDYVNDNGAAAVDYPLPQEEQANPMYEIREPKMVALKPTKTEDTILGMPAGAVKGAAAVVVLILFLAGLYWWYNRAQKAEGGEVGAVGAPETPVAPVAPVTTEA